MLLPFLLCSVVNFSMLSAHVLHRCKIYRHKWSQVFVEIPQNHPKIEIKLIYVQKKIDS